MTTTNTPKRKTESGHWYDRHATLVEQVPAKTQKKGEPTKMVDVTLRQARELQLAPGQSTIRQIKDKKQLNNWREQQVLMAALTLPRATGAVSARVPPFASGRGAPAVGRSFSSSSAINGSSGVTG